MTPHALLSTPLRLPSGFTLRNRIAKSAMSEGFARPETAAPNERHVRLYERWGRSGAGLLMTGNVMVSPEGRGEAGNVVIVDDRHRAALRRWAEAGQQHGASLWMQLNHAGRQAPRFLHREPVAPSAVAMKKVGPAFAMPRALRDAEIRTIIARFAAAAALARDTGFGGVQIHGAHGYLVSQFLSPLTNLRDDDWGGDPQRRMRFLLELVRAMRAAVGPDYPVGVKLNSADFQRGGFADDDAIDVLRALEAEGVDLVEVSGGSYEAPAMMRPKKASTLEREAYFFTAAKRFRDAVRTPLMLTGGFRSAKGMADALGSGAIDLAGLARPMAAEPDLPARLLADPAARALSIDLRSPIPRVDALLDILWYQAQMFRMADGKEPDPSLGKWRALMLGARLNLLHRSAPRALPAPASAAA